MRTGKRSAITSPSLNVVMNALITVSPVKRHAGVSIARARQVDNAFLTLGRSEPEMIAAASRANERNYLSALFAETEKRFQALALAKAKAAVAKAKQKAKEKAANDKAKAKSKAVTKSTSISVSTAP